MRKFYAMGIIVILTLIIIGCNNTSLIPVEPDVKQLSLNAVWNRIVLELNLPTKDAKLVNNFSILYSEAGKIKAFSFDALAGQDDYVRAIYENNGLKIERSNMKSSAYTISLNKLFNTIDSIGWSAFQKRAYPLKNADYYFSVTNINGSSLDDYLTSYLVANGEIERIVKKEDRSLSNGEILLEVNRNSKNANPVYFIIK